MKVDYFVWLEEQKKEKGFHGQKFGIMTKDWDLESENIHIQVLAPGVEFRASFE